jgi:hypothetical protein
MVKRKERKKEKPNNRPLAGGTSQDWIVTGIDCSGPSASQLKNTQPLAETKKNYLTHFEAGVLVGDHDKPSVLTGVEARMTLTALASDDT